MAALTESLSLCCILLLLFVDFSSSNSHFQVYWNVPSGQCLRNYDINLEPILRTYGILANDGDIFQGEEITIFYDSQLGLYPHFNKEGIAVNGGLPQLADLDQHLKTAIIDLEKVIPDKHWNGVGVIDWEAWRPVWEFNWGSLSIYQRKSLQVAKEKNPLSTDEAIKKLAEEQWENSTKSWMLNTLDLARQLRPRGRWGFYLFPDCYNYEGNTPEEFRCSDGIVRGNNKLKWLWEASTAVYPSLYIHENHMIKYTFKQRTWFTNGRLQEARRVAFPGAPIYPYISYSITPKTLVAEEDFWRILAQVASVGSEGAVVWGSSASVGSKSLCLQLQDYVVDVLGPAVKKIAWNTGRCATSICNGRGRCTWPQDPNVLAWKFLMDKEDHTFYAGDIVCRCNEGFSGRFCQNVLSF